MVHVQNVNEPTKLVFYQTLSDYSEVRKCDAGFKLYSCSICFEPFTDPNELNCGHTFCRGCIRAHMLHGVNDMCPHCRAQLPSQLQDVSDEMAQHRTRGNYQMVKHISR
jgi:hypothetical protein